MQDYVVYCLTCGAQQPRSALRCVSCSGSLNFRYERAFEPDPRFGNSMWRYWTRLPVSSPDHIVTLREGGTPLLPSRGVTGVRLWFKDETRNPTGSHKDRALAVAVTHAQAIGRKLSVVVSSGSTGISNAAASARAGIGAVVMVARGVPEERIYPAHALGATIVEVDAEVDEIVERVSRLGASGDVYVSSTARGSNPYQAEAPKTIAYEIVEQLGRAPDWMVVPVGGGGTIAGIWRGFKDLSDLGQIERAPRLLGVVASGYDAVARAFQENLDDPNVIYPPDYRAAETILVKIAHVYPPDGAEALAALRESGGAAVVVTEQEAVDAQRFIGQEEGLYVEPSSAVALAGFERARDSRIIHDDATVTLLLSGSGFRETFVSSQRGPAARERVSAGEISSMLAAHEARFLS